MKLVSEFHDYYDALFAHSVKWEVVSGGIGFLSFKL